MVAIAKRGRPVVATGAPSHEHQFAGHYAAEDIGAGDAVQITADGVRKWVTGARYAGVAAGPASIGEAVTIYHGVTFHYGSGLPVGAAVFLSTTVPGGLDDATAVGASVPVGFTVDGSRIFFYSLNATVA